MLFEYNFIDYICISYGDMKRFSSSPKRPVAGEYFGFLSGFLSSREVFGEIFDYGQYIIHPETLCRTEWYTDTILALTAYIHGHSEQMPLPPNIACGTLLSITLVSIENSPVYIPSYIACEDTYCTHALHTHTRWLLSQDPFHTKSIGIHVSKWTLLHSSHAHDSLRASRVRLDFLNFHLEIFMK